MKIKIGEKEYNISSLYDTVEKTNSEISRQAVVTLSGCMLTTDELFQELENFFIGSFVIIKEDSSEEVYEGFKDYTVNRNLQGISDQMTVRFTK